MTKKWNIKGNKELVAGLITLGAAVLLLLVTVLSMTQCTSPEPTSPSGTMGTLDHTIPEGAIIPNPYNNGDFAYRNGFLTCISGPSRLGIDVSSHQEVIDWPTVAQQGISFAMVRLGYRGYSNGQIMPDTMSLTNLQGAKAAGMQVGAYFYSQAVSVEEAQEEARFVLEILDGMALSMPVVFDWEIFREGAVVGRTGEVDSKALNACAKAFCDIITEAGYEAMIYFNLDVADRLLDLKQLQAEGYKFWLALYGDMTFPHRVDMWQYTEKGNIKGINGNVDLNLYFTY